MRAWIDERLPLAVHEPDAPRRGRRDALETIEHVVRPVLPAVSGVGDRARLARVEEGDVPLAVDGEPAGVHRVSGWEVVHRAIVSRVIDELLEHLADAGADDPAWLVYGDALLADGDERGELIALQARLARARADEIPSLVDARAPLVEREPRLAALFLPLVELPPFVGGSAPVARWALDDGEERLTVDASWGVVRVELDGQVVRELSDVPTRWSDATTTVYLSLVAEALRDGTLDRLALPVGEALSTDLRYRPGPLPLAFAVACRLPHVHTWRCESEEAWPAWRRALFDYVADERVRRRAAQSASR